MPLISPITSAQTLLSKGILTGPTPPPDAAEVPLKPLELTTKPVTGVGGAETSTIADAELPIPVYQFSFMVSTTPVAFFQKISGISFSRDVEPLSEGGNNAYTYEFPGQVSYNHITLEGGLTSSKFFEDWMLSGHYGGTAQGLDFDIVLRRSDPTGAEPYVDVKQWTFENGYPVKWKISSLNIENSKSFVIESLEISFDFFWDSLTTPDWLKSIISALS